MRVALLHPTYWPEVRRGSERLVHDLAGALAERGHRVSVLASHRGPSRTTLEGGVRVTRYRRPPDLPGLSLHEYHVRNLPALLWQLARGGFDLVHAFFPTDAWAAARLRRRGGPPFIFSMHGIPTREYLVARRYRLEMLRAIVAGADECTVLSEAAAEPFRRFLLRDPHVLPGGVVEGTFSVQADRSELPTILSTASLGDGRKRAAVLFGAFELLRRRNPDARLVLAGGRDPVIAGEGLVTAPGAEWRRIDDDEQLALAYGSAWTTVLPSVEEAFGLVLLESLAAGTPVVAARSGACPEIVTDERIGRLFAPDDEVDLARAIEEALELGAAPPVRERCRRRARDFDWARVVGEYERLYERVLSAGGAGRPGGGARGWEPAPHSGGERRAPEVSVVIPTRDRENRLAFALEALAQQTLPPDRFEVVVVRDEDARGPYAQPPEGLTVRYGTSRVPGPAAQRNVGWRSAAAPLIAFTDDDCRPAPDWLERLLERWEGRGDRFVQGPTEPDPDELHLLFGLARTQSVERPSEFFECCNIAYPRRLLEKLEGFDEAFFFYGEDTDLGLRARKLGAERVFADRALVRHAVESRPPHRALADAARRRSVPLVVRRHPEHREAYFLRVFWRRSHAELLLLFAGALGCATGRRWAALAWVPYFLEQARGVPRTPRGVIRHALHMPMRASVDLAEVAATARAAVRARTLLL